MTIDHCLFRLKSRLHHLFVVVVVVIVVEKIGRC
jgi:hypothetical protein